MRGSEVDTRRWEIGLTAALIAGAAGVLASSPAVFLASTVGLTYAVYGYLTRSPPTAVAVDRTLGNDSPLPGADVEVTVTVTNAADRPVADLRVVDRVPETLEVVEGSPAFAATLSPDETVSYTYTVRARRGDHVFEPPVVVTRDVAGAGEYRREAGEAIELTCRSGPETVPLEGLTLPHTGRIETDDGGEGVAFYGTREYKPGDPTNRIDWNRYARTGELTTVEYREDRAAVVVLVVDVRSVARVVREPGEPDAVELATYAAEEAVDALVERHNHVGLVRYGGGDYLRPGTGRDHALRIRRLLREGGESMAGDPMHSTVPHGARRVDELVERLPPEAQVVLVSPLLDDDPVDAARRFRAHGHAVTLLTPDVTTGGTPGGALARLDRDGRVGDLRGDGLRVLAWSPDEPLYSAVSRAERRWSG